MTGRIFNEEEAVITHDIIFMGEPKKCPFLRKTDLMEEKLWYVLFVANGKAVKVKIYLEEAGLRCFFPMYYKERKIGGNDENAVPALYPLLGNLIFVKSSRKDLDPLVKEIKLKYNIKSELYYRDLGTKKIIVVPEIQMSNFIAIAGKPEEQIIYLSNEEVRMKQGTKVKIIGGVFEGVEGIFMRIRGDKRVVVSIPNLFSVATAYLPVHFLQSLE